MGDEHGKPPEWTFIDHQQAFSRIVPHLGDHTEKPLQASLLHDARRGLNVPDQPAECSADTHHDSPVDLVVVGHHPFFLPAAAETHPDDVGLLGVDAVDDVPVVLLGKFPERRTVSGDVQVRVDLQRLFFHPGDGAFRISEKEMAVGFGFLKEPHHQVHPGDTLDVAATGQAGEPGKRSAVGQ